MGPKEVGERKLLRTTARERTSDPVMRVDAVRSSKIIVEIEFLAVERVAVFSRLGIFVGLSQLSVFRQVSSLQLALP